MGKMKRELFEFLDELDANISYSWFTREDKDIRIILMKGDGQIISDDTGFASIMLVDEELLRDIIDDSYPNIKRKYLQWLDK